MKRTEKKRLYIREWRKHKRLSLQRLAERIGISHSTLSRIETGKTPYKQPMLERVAEELGCEPVDLLIRDPSDPEGIWSVWDNLKPEQKPQALRLLKALNERAA